MVNSYAATADVLVRLPGLDPVDVMDVLSAMSRWIDGHCDRKFWLDPTATIRVFAACDLYELDLGVHEIGAASPVTVKTDDGTGTFATTLAASAYQLEPINAPFAPAGAAPYTSVRALTTSWPRAYTRSGRQDLVQITAKYGWPAVPAPVKEACIVLTVDHFENPAGVRSESIDGYSVTYGAMQAAKSLLVDGNMRRQWAA